MAAYDRERAVQVLGPDLVAFAEGLRVISGEPAKDAPDTLPQAPEIGWGDNFHVFCRGLAEYATDSAWLKDESSSIFQVASVEEFLEWPNGDGFIETYRELLIDMKFRFSAEDDVAEYQNAVRGFNLQAKRDGDWVQAEHKAELLASAVPHKLGFRAVNLFAVQQLYQPMRTVAELLEEAGYYR